MITINPKESTTQEVHHALLGGIAPRPIAFASTIDKDGNPNLSPFSFFNAFGANPPTIIFSPARRGKDNTNKHTFFNVNEVPEVVINMVTFDMVQQMSLASADFPKGVNEFKKAGFTMLKSESVRPFRVKESPIQFECIVKQVIETGQEGGAGNLVICEVSRIHIDEDILGDDGHIDPNLADLVGRMGGNYYVRTSGESLFEIPKPVSSVGIGIDQIPDFIKNIKEISSAELAQLASIDKLPSKVEFQKDNLPKEVLFGMNNKELMTVCYAKDLIYNNHIKEALMFLMLNKEDLT